MSVRVVALVVMGIIPVVTAATTGRVSLDPPAMSPAIHELGITASDYAFDAPNSVPAGLTTIHLINKGPELHHVMLFRLEGGHTMADFGKALASDAIPAWAIGVGGPNAAMPGAESSTTVDLAPGQYVLTCFIPSADGMPHAMKGMNRPLTVTGMDVPVALPQANTTMTMVDYAFDLSRPLVSGRQVIRVRNTAVQPHEMVLVRLTPGKSVADMAAWAEKPVGPPPATFLGGVTALSRGHESELTVDLTRGDYALICFLPDIHDGKPHLAHGMTQQFTIT